MCIINLIWIFEIYCQFFLFISQLSPPFCNCQNCWEKNPDDEVSQRDKLRKKVQCSLIELHGKSPLSISKNFKNINFSLLGCLVYSKFLINSTAILLPLIYLFISSLYQQYSSIFIQLWWWRKMHCISSSGVDFWEREKKKFYYAQNIRFQDKNYTYTYVVYLLP